MNLSNELIENLHRRTWYNSRLDDNGTFLAIMLSKKIGSIDAVDYPMVSYDLPNKNDTFILLTLGVINPVHLGLGELGDGWVEAKTLFDMDTWFVCFAMGRKYNTTNCFIQITKQNELLIALDYFGNNFIDTITTHVYVRFYTNVYFSNPTLRANGKLAIKCIVITNSKLEYLQFSTGVTNTEQHLVFKNGLLMVAGLPEYESLVINDVVEVIHDSSITHKHLIPITNPVIYRSTLDVANKILISIEDVNDSQFVADDEFFITGTTHLGKVVGGYFPRINLPIVRPLTYKDYGLNSQLVYDMLVSMSSFKDVGQLSNVNVMVIRRTSGRSKKSVNGSNYISDLMNLPLNIRQQALTGVNANLPIWNATNLESCPYNVFIQHLNLERNYDSYYGVYSRKELLAHIENPAEVDSGNWLMPVDALDSGTFITFDSSGKHPEFIPVDRISIGLGCHSGRMPIYLPFGIDNTLVEIMVEVGSTDPVLVSANSGVMCLYFNVDWKVATLGIDYTLIDNPYTNLTEVSWNNRMLPYKRQIRSSANSVGYICDCTLTDLLYGIPVYGNGVVEFDYGMRNLLVWCNGDYLVYGLDYVLYDKKLYLTSKRSSWSPAFKLTVIYSGIPNNNLVYTDKSKFGFVKYNSILEDNIYDLIAYRNKLIFVDGALYTLEQIQEKESYLDIVDKVVTPFTNGTVYAIVDRPQFFRDDILDLFTKTEEAERQDDITISKYLTAIYPQPMPNGIIVIPKLYEVVSILMNALIGDIVNNTLQGLIYSEYTNDQLYTLLQPYMWYLKIDLTITNLDLNYIIVSPSWDTGPFFVNLHEYAFLSTVNSVLLGNKVQRLDTYLTTI
jgi:hypothetical protein